MCVGVLVPAWTIQPCFTLQPVFAVSLYAFFSRQQGLSTLILAEGCLVGCQGVGSFFSRAQAESVLQKCYMLCSYYTYPVDACTHTWLTWLFFPKDCWKVGQPKLVPAHCHEGVKVNSIVQPSSHGISPIFEFLDGLIYTTKWGESTDWSAGESVRLARKYAACGMLLMLPYFAGSESSLASVMPSH